MKKIQYLLLGSLMLLLAACEKDTVATSFAPGVTTGNVTDIYRKGAVLSGSIQKTGNAMVKNYGILFSALESMAEYTEHPVTDGNADFSISIPSLTPGTTYYYCAYASSGITLAQGEVKSFTTPASNAPIFAEISLLEKNEFGCKVSASFVDEGGSAISLSGFCWTKRGEGEPTTDSTVQNAHVEGGSISATITGLEPDSEYQLRAYAVNSDGVGYSEILVVRTNEATVPVLSSIIEKESHDFSVTVEAGITDAGSYEVTQAGFCWSTTNPTPTIEDEKKELEGSTLTMALENLEPSTTYYIRAYATNEAGTSYSEVFTFTTADAKAPTLSEITQTASSYFSVSVQAEVTDEGTSEVTASGFCWSTTNELPTTEDNKKELAGPTLHMTLDNLESSTTYYIRAYAISEVGTSYSEVFTFITADAKTPTLSAIEKTAFTDFSVSVKVEITDAGTASVTKSGFCWSTTNSTPTTGDTKKELEGPALETTLENLTPNTTYYIRAYATNRFGTSYSEVFTFKTAAKDAGNGNTDINGLPVIKW